MDMINHPNHYKSETGLETIDVIEAFTFDLKGIEATDTGNILKYMCRWNSKNGLEDLKKARWYLNHLIEHVEKRKQENSIRPNYDALRNTFFFTSCDKMKTFLDDIREKAGSYAYCTLDEALNIYSIPSTDLDEYYGWYEADLTDDNIEIKEINEGHMLVLPKPHDLRGKYVMETLKGDNK